MSRVCTCACDSSLAVLHWILEVEKTNLGSTLPLVWFSFFYERSVCHLDWHLSAVDGWTSQLDFSAQAYRCSQSMLELSNVKERAVIHEVLNSESETLGLLHLYLFVVFSLLGGISVA